jgi:hypothetical protein
MSLIESVEGRKSVIHRIYNCFTQSIKPALKTIRWLLSLMIPISFGVMLLEYSGILKILAEYTAPFVKMLGLRGEAALVLLSGGLLNIYSAIAVIESIDFSMREITIMALMSLIAHNLIVETAVQKKTGSSGLWILLLRISMAIVGGMLLNWLLPANSVVQHAKIVDAVSGSFAEIFNTWIWSTLKLIIKVIVIIFALNFLQRLLDEFSITVYLSKLMSPILRLFGLPVQASFMWLIANIIGLAWGSGVLIEQTEQGKISKKEADILNQHIAISHSLLEDTLLFVAIGVSAFWITFPRLFLALIVVWFHRLVFLKYKS